MRTPFVALVALVMTLILGPVVVIARLFRAPQGPNSIYSRSVRLWARSIDWAAGVRLRVHGTEHLEGLNGAVFIANHVSWFDITVLARAVPWCSFIAKSELRRIPLFGFAAECVGIVFLDRDNRKQAFESYKMAAKEVQLGRSIVVCPEGTRGLDYHLRPFKKGPFVLAIASQTPIIPTIVFGAREVLAKGSFAIRSGTIDLHFLPPVETAGYDYDDRGALMTTVWTNMADAMQSLYGIGTSEPSIATTGERVE
ncbi:MAG TPA: lysophospholipid acyltransferase family protein [Gemmatimonadaceae bacterium]|jgi:1-acyl-sn-glycerol-3-phosphate acyltransferase|nr:lysophospholipid acyltransferase family protein [Gemmatimonadaceae bacterium]